MPWPVGHVKIHGMFGVSGILIRQNWKEELVSIRLPLPIRLQQHCAIPVIHPLLAVYHK